MKHMLTAIFLIALLTASAPLFAVECGDVNNSGTIDILDVTNLIDHLYKSGPVPSCHWGDINGSNEVNILDITRLIGFLYKEGPAPDCLSGTVTDIDGNIYRTVKICEQWWMVEDLKVTHYRNGDPIPIITDNGEWLGLTAGAYCEYNNDQINVANYGRLYNWFSATDSRNIAPEGWHVPSAAEWQTLSDFLGADGGGRLKEAGTLHWTSPNSGATNESKFNSLPGGLREFNNGDYAHKAEYAAYWSVTPGSNNIAGCLFLAYNSSMALIAPADRTSGLSIRCIKD